MSHICCCADPICDTQGCKLLKKSAPTPLYPPNIPGQLPYPYIQEKGCICPPGAESTCLRWDCGRKSQRYGYTYNTSVTTSVSVPQLLVEDNMSSNT